MAMKEAKVFTVTSVKGGTGKTTFALNLAATFSKLNYKTLIIDLDVYSGEIALDLNANTDKNLFTVIDDMNNNRFTFIDNYISQYNNNIDVLPAPVDPRLASKINLNYISVLLRKAKMKYQVIVIDTNNMLSDINLMAYDYSDYILYVTNNSPADLKNLKSILSIHKDMEQENYKVVLYDATNNKRNIFSKYDIQSIIKDDINYVIDKSFFIKDIDKYILDGKILLLDSKLSKKHKKTYNCFLKIAKNLINENQGEE